MCSFHDHYSTPPTGIHLAFGQNFPGHLDRLVSHQVLFDCHRNGFCAGGGAQFGEDTANIIFDR
jgi:hypothetical protein